MSVNNCYIILEESCSLELFNFIDLIWFKSQWILRWVHKSTFRDICNFTLYLVKFFLIQTFFCSFSLGFNVNNTQLLDAFFQNRTFYQHSWLLSSEFTIYSLFLWALLGLLRLCGLGSCGTPFQEQWVTLWAEPLHIFLFSVASRENKIACVSTNVLTPSWLYTRCLRVSVCTWTQVPMPRFSATDVLLTKYIWIWFLSGFSCPSQKLLKCSAAETLCGTVKAWRLYRALFFCEDVTFLTRVVVRLRLQQKCSSFLQTRYAGTHPCAGTGHRLSVLCDVTPPVLSV